jgi:hypothetical protein
MSRRRTRQVNKTKARKRQRSLPGKGMGARVAATAAAAVAALFSLVPPVKALAARALAWAWHSRDVRRLAGVTAGLAVLAALSWVMLNNLSGTGRYSVDPARIELSTEPAWATGSLARRLKATIEDDLRAEVADLAPSNAFDAGLMATITDCLQRNAWVRRVVSIERRFPSTPEGHSRLIPHLEVRRPAVMVETTRAYVLVDGDGVVLPLSVPNHELQEFRSQLAQPLHTVRGVVGDAPSAGTVWRSEQVAAALSMERIVRRAELDKCMPIEAIELVGVPQHPDSRGRVFYAAGGAVMLVPDQVQLPGSLVIWGRPPVHAGTLERSPNDKLDELRRKLDSGELAAKPIDLRRPG